VRQSQEDQRRRESLYSIPTVATIGHHAPDSSDLSRIENNSSKIVGTHGRSRVERDGDAAPATSWALIRSLKDSDRNAAWTEFTELYHRAIFRFARGLGLRSAEAEDIVQITFIAVASSIHEFQTSPDYGSFRAWLFRLARWRIYDHHRQRAREARWFTSLDSLTEGGVGLYSSKCIPERAPDAFDSLEALWSREWERAIIETALERIRCKVPARQHQVFYMHVIQEQSAGIVAKATGTNIALVYLYKSRVSRLVRLEAAKLIAQSDMPSGEDHPSGRL
jgi:RNA polymerase sigma-70 factor (ECF subfamily)